MQETGSWAAPHQLRLHNNSTAMDDMSETLTLINTPYPLTKQAVYVTRPNGHDRLPSCPYERPGSSWNT